jgi:hypothetical protein
VPRFTPIRLLTKGFGGPAAAVILRAFIPIGTIVEGFRQVIIGSARESLSDVSTFSSEYDDNITIYKISAALTEINRSPLDNPIFNRMTRLVFEKQISLSATCESVSSRDYNPYTIVIGDKKPVRGKNE